MWMAFQLHTALPPRRYMYYRDSLHWGQSVKHHELWSSPSILYIFLLLYCCVLHAGILISFLQTLFRHIWSVSILLKDVLTQNWLSVCCRYWTYACLSFLKNVLRLYFEHIFTLSLLSLPLSVFFSHSLSRYLLRFAAAAQCWLALTGLSLDLSCRPFVSRQTPHNRAQIGSWL